MKQFVRTFVLLPALILALVAIPTVVFSAAGGADGGVDAFIAGLTESAAQRHHQPPAFTDARGHRAHAAAHVHAPTDCLPDGDSVGRRRSEHTGRKDLCDGPTLIKVIGNRLSPTIYGYTTRLALPHRQ